MKKLHFLLLFVFYSLNLFSQNFTVNVKGIQENDSIRVIIQKDQEKLLKAWVYYDPSGNSSVTFNLEDGLWALFIDATGYTFPASSVFNIPEVNNAMIELTPMLNENFEYHWRDDGSSAGHATQSYIAEPTEIIVFNDTLKVPIGFSALKLRTEYGIVLSDEKEPWSNEDAYRLYKMFTNLPYGKYGEGQKLDLNDSTVIRGVFYLTNDEQYRDLSIEKNNGIKYATVSQSAFTYANPQIVKLDGIRGKFFSKRLYHAVVNFITEFASNQEAVNWLARERFGIEFLKPSDFLESLMGEDQSNFQEFYNSEKLEILAMFEELPEGFHKQEGLKYMVRRIDGQVHPLYKTAAAIAWTGRNTIEYMDKAFLTDNLNDTRRLILHEKAHFLWEYTFDQNIKDEWADIGGWFIDPTTASGWSTYNTTEFVSAYAHLKNPNEDMAESIANYLTNPDRLINVSMKKYEFIRDRIMHGTRYVAQIREDLTFTVYNLYPDYVLPGKVISVDINIEGKPEEDKKITIKAILKSENPELDGAAGAYLRFASSIGSIFDIGLSPQNGSIDSVLIGSRILQKELKSGYWNLAFFNVTDQVGNMRYENTSTLGLKLFLENPLEDITPPRFNFDYENILVNDYFSDGYNYNVVIDSTNGKQQQAIQFKYSWNDQSPTEYGSNLRIKFPNSSDSELYFKEAHGDAKNNQIEKKEYNHYFLIPEYFPTGFYKNTMMYTRDKANLFSNVFFVDDTSDFKIDSRIQPPNTFKFTRDSIYVKTEFPDIKSPEIDINNIYIKAEPTNPNNPDGETRVDIEFFARDFSDYEGKESGIQLVSFVLRDPQGKESGYQTGNGTMNHPDLPNGAGGNTPKYGDDWKLYRFNMILPKGSAPGKWGLAAAFVTDLVGNSKKYSFTEYIRFDIIESEIQLEKPLEIEIIDKVINAKNVESINVKLGCVPCAGLNYVSTIYSRFGGGAVIRSEGTLDSNEVIIRNLNTKGILDGEINLTVQLLDSSFNLISTKTTKYTKDVVYPKSYYTRHNLQNDGYSNLDDLVIEVKYDSVDLGGNYQVVISEYTPNINQSKNSNFQTLFLTLNSSILLTGKLEGEINLKNFDLSGISDGIISISLKIIDPSGNEGEEIIEYYSKKVGSIKYIGSEITDDDNDGVLNAVDKCPQTPSGTQVTEDGCELILGINNEPHGLIAYPNPFKEILTIKFNQDMGEMVDIRISNTLGQEVYSKSRITNVQSINLKHLPSGQYILNIQSMEKNGKGYNLKIVKE